MFRGRDSGALHLLLVAGGNRIGEEVKVGEPLDRADAAEVRRCTGFAIGGVAPIGHLEPPRVAIDTRLLDFGLVWAAAGTPRHVFSAAPHALAQATGAAPVALQESGQLASGSYCAPSGSRIER